MLKSHCVSLEAVRSAAVAALKRMPTEPDRKIKLLPM